MAKRILVVDDEPDIVAVMKFTLESRGFEVITAYDGKEGLDKARTFKPDIIILDVLMSKMYDNTLVAELENNDTKNIPIIFLSCLVDRSTTYTEQDMRGRILLPKSCSEEELMEAINRALGGNQNNLVDS